jgi:transposase
MFIKEIKTRNKKTGKEYTKHALVESVRTAKGPRQRTVMQLGQLKLPRDLWPQLIAELESRISGQLSLSIPGTKIPRKVKDAADTAMENFTICTARRIENRKDVENEEVTVNLDNVCDSKYRSFGPEFVAHSIWEELRMPQKLKELGFSSKERSLAEGIVAGRLIKPASELSTWSWLKNSSSIGDLTEASLENVGLTSVYKIGDKLLEHKSVLEEHLFNREQKLHPGREVLYLFDLTNFYFEGQALGNSLAKHGKSKEKRNDCPLVSLGLIVDSSGFPVTSEIFPGNIGEPKTLNSTLEKMGYFENYLPGMLPMLVMDRGIATRDNVKLLEEKNLPYILITRGARNTHYLKEFENHKSDPEFKTIVRNGKEIRIKKVNKADAETVEVLCVSEGKKAKENAIRRRWTERASEDIARLQSSIAKGSIKEIGKIVKKIGRLEERYAGLNKYFSINIQEDTGNPGVATGLKFYEKPVFDIDKCEDDPLHGTYVIETGLKDKSAEDIWTLYMTLTRVEEAFRCMKSDLGTRPVYHQIARRTKGHLFISILAYHLLINIEYKMGKANDMRRWSTIREVLSTHQRSTIIITDKKQRVHHLRLSGQPEPCHSQVYNILKITPGKLLKKYIIAKRL